ncbi:MAG TPA: copper resistance protein CopC [Gaiellaceae bacterium]|nr:copper resistance protein CopC [Gaiellaceae bacterium]
MRRALVAVCVAALAVPASAAAHASLRHEFPAFGERLHSSPAEVTLRFDQVVDALPGGIRVFDVNGRNYAGPVHARDRMLVARVARLPRGPYTIRWRAMSLDGHVVSGVWTFGVRVPAPNVVDDSVGAGGPTTAEHVVRWLWFVALALLLGGIGFRLLVVRAPLPRRFWIVTGVAAIGTLEVAIVAFLLRCEDALQLPFGNFLYGDLSPIANGTRIGQAFVVMELGFALVAALLFLAWLTDREERFLWPAFVLGLGFASGLSLSGHSAERASSSFADWVHLAAACLWIGGLVQLAAVVWPQAPELRRRSLLGFSRLATICVALLVGAGVYLSILRLPAVHDLWRTRYGDVLLVKLALVAVALAWGALHNVVVRRRGLVRAGTLVAESAVAIAVLLAAAVLVDSRPPAPVPAAPAAVQHR